MWLQSDNGLLLTNDLIVAHIYDFFIGLLGTAEEKALCLRDARWAPSERVTQEANEGLGLAFLPEEIDRALHDMKTDTAPGPDGWPVEFFKKFWSKLKSLFYELVNGFALGTVDLSRLNYGAISMIPKVKGADDIKQFRPITLINVPFKICAKAYASRLAPVAQRVISPSQSGFLKQRNILEGPLALLEIVHELKRTKSRGVILKLDFEKAYDRVNWEFVRQVLIKKGFDVGFVHRIMHLVSSGHTAVTINGVMGKFFRNKRGLRQGDPSSPLIFNFVADALAALISKARAAGHIKGLISHLIPGGVTHLQYADDTMLLFEPDDHSIATIKLLLIAFEILSSLKINFLKSEVITIGMDDHEGRRVTNLLNCKIGKFPIKYLGLPINHKNLTIADWAPLYGKVVNRVSPWRGRFMSSAARLILTNSSLSSLPIFTMGMFLLADGVHAKLDTPCSWFFWEGTRD